MGFILIDGPEWFSLFPLTLTRPTSYIRIGILTLKEKWELLLKNKTHIFTKSYLKDKYSSYIKENINIFINPTFIPNKNLIYAIFSLKEDQILVKKNKFIAFCTRKKNISNLEKIKYSDKLIHIKYPWDIFRYNSIALKKDFFLLTNNRISSPISKSNFIKGKNIFIEKGAIVENSILNSNIGPIYIGKNSHIMEGCLIRGGLALCEGSILNMGTKIYGDTTIGPYCKIGGEIENSIFFSYSNKAHNGFIGNSVIGEWCNLGAGTNISNLKNNYSDINVWSMYNKENIKTGLKFCGLFMGDFSKSSINTQFNTGTIVGVSANIFGYGFPPKYISSFSWGGIQKNEIFNFDKSCESAKIMMSRRNKIFNLYDKNILNFIYSKYS